MNKVENRIVLLKFKANIKSQMFLAQEINKRAKSALAAARKTSGAKALKHREDWGLYLQANTPKDQWDRRSCHLAYAFLKGKTYNECEKRDPHKASYFALYGASYIFNALRPFLPETEKRATWQMSIALWLKKGDITRYQIEENLQTCWQVAAQSLEKAAWAVQASPAYNREASAALRDAEDRFLAL